MEARWAGLGRLETARPFKAEAGSNQAAERGGRTLIASGCADARQDLMAGTKQSRPWHGEGSEPPHGRMRSASNGRVMAPWIEQGRLDGERMLRRGRALALDSWRGPQEKRKSRVTASFDMCAACRERWTTRQPTQAERLLLTCWHLGSLASMHPIQPCSMPTCAACQRAWAAQGSVRPSCWDGTGETGGPWARVQWFLAATSAGAADKTWYEI